MNANSQSKADVAINEAERLIDQEKVEIVTGVYSCAHAVPLAAGSRRRRRSCGSPAAIATAVLKDKQSELRLPPDVHSDQYGEASASSSPRTPKKLGVEPKNVKLACIYEDGPYGTGVAARPRAIAKKQAACRSC